MPLPGGFVAVHPIETPPFVAPSSLRLGAIVKYVRSRETAATDDRAESQVIDGYISRAGSGLMVHEFKSRGGLGLPFKLIGDPGLTARLCVIKPGWIIWLQHETEPGWVVGAAYDLVKLRALQVKMRDVDHELDRAIVEASGAFMAGTRTVGLEDITAPGRRVPLTEKTRVRLQKMRAPEQQQRARALLREELALSPRPIADVARMFAAQGFAVEQLYIAVEQIAAVVVRSATPGRKSVRMLRILAHDAWRVKMVADTPLAVRAEIMAELAEREAAERALEEAEHVRATELAAEFFAAPGTADDDVEDEPGALEQLEAEEEQEDRRLDEIFRGRGDAAGTVLGSLATPGELKSGAEWLRTQLAKGAKRLAEIRREMPAPTKALDQEQRDRCFLHVATNVGLVVRLGHERMRGYWIELNRDDAADADALTAALRVAMTKEGSPHIPYPEPRAWC